MPKGIGVDIVSVSRIKEALERNEGFAERILTELEVQRMHEVAQKAHFVAKRFAAKEAVVKALGNGIGNGIDWHQIEVSNDEKGAPLVKLKGRALELMHEKGGTECLLSLSDEHENAIAFAILS